MNKTEKVSMEKLHPIICEAIRDDGQFVFYPTGTSMLPTIIPGEDCVILIEANHIKKYDLVLFLRQNGIYVLHRIVNIKNGEYIIMGDNQNWFEKITRDQIIAKVSEIRKKNGKILTQAEFSSGGTILSLDISRFSKRVLNKIKRIFKGRKQ